MIHQILSGPLVREAGLVTDDDVRQINSLSNPPPVPVSPRDVYVRRCRLAGDAVDAYYGRFRTEDLPRLLALTQGAPLLVGHNKQSLGVARFFGGAVEERDGVHYIVPRFYWLRGHSSADDLRVAIDGGIYHEASISFVFARPTCSVCGEDIRTCEHLPGAPGEDSPVFYYYDEIAAVLEGSLVYRGAQPGTGFSLGRGGIYESTPAPAGSAFEAPFSLQEALPGGLSVLQIKRHGKWYRAPLVEDAAPDDF
jgi:hypothetical protein